MEQWKPVLGYEGLYEISNDGRVKRLARRIKTSIKHSDSRFLPEIILNGTVIKRGYVQVKLTKQGNGRVFLVHELVANAFIPNLDNKKTVNHKDGDKTNNNVANLEWMTVEENLRHAWQTGLCRDVARKQGRPVVCVETGDVFISSYAAAKWLDRDGNKRIHAKNIRRCANGEFKMMYGYHWKNL